MQATPASKTPATPPSRGEAMHPASPSVIGGKCHAFLFSPHPVFNFLEVFGRFLGEILGKICSFFR
ncbi:MAG: hypothetical protein MJE68_02895, partial [Proteobacteria bacterium]|nr:hypothetical protein [Pseudomonadota bacterium]